MESSTINAPRKPRRKISRGRIEPHILYPLEEFKALSGLGNFALRTARRNGLFVRKANGRSSVYGQDYLDYQNRVCPKPENSSSPAGQPTPAAEPAATA
jgi:hypothetical protein